ncbi:MAG: hypothetical protein Q7T11_02195 [Deltaproteobacteria bacterium]|nr:hypothetical protein [Deltaproteobacteria bacterium]
MAGEIGAVAAMQTAAIGSGFLGAIAQGDAVILKDVLHHGPLSAFVAATPQVAALADSFIRTRIGPNDPSSVQGEIANLGRMLTSPQLNAAALRFGLMHFGAVVERLSDEQHKWLAAQAHIASMMLAAGIDTKYFTGECDAGAIREAQNLVERGLVTFDPSHKGYIESSILDDVLLSPHMLEGHNMSLAAIEAGLKRMSPPLEWGYWERRTLAKFRSDLLKVEKGEKPFFEVAREAYNRSYGGSDKDIGQMFFEVAQMSEAHLDPNQSDAYKARQEYLRVANSYSSAAGFYNSAECYELAALSMLKEAQVYRDGNINDAKAAQHFFDLADKGLTQIYHQAADPSERKRVLKMILSLRWQAVLQYAENRGSVGHGHVRYILAKNEMSFAEDLFLNGYAVGAGRLYLDAASHLEQVDPELLAGVPELRTKALQEAERMAVASVRESEDSQTMAALGEVLRAYVGA